ncbi:MAG: DUF3817 domain-containing protein [Cyanobacteriota bacterium]
MNSELGRLRTIALCEGVSYMLLLFIAMPMKYILGLAIAVKIVGMLHGILFVLMIFSIAEVKGKNLLPFDMLIKVFIASLIPFGTFIIDKQLKEKM